MATNSNLSQNTSDDNLPQKEFAFVEHESSKKELRSHAMREHWKNRRQTMNEEKQKRQKRTQHTLLPTPTTQSTMSDENSESSSSVLNSNTSSVTALIPNNERQPDLEGIPSQILSGVNLVFGSSRLDPFEQLPMELSVTHHKLLHHWFSAHAAMMFGPSPDGAFSPMRDVWLPLDLSNPASFNALMALSAAHLSRMQSFSQSEVALEFKSEAVRIVQLWMQDPERAVSDDVLAAILRLLTYERYWGTESEWIIHHKGLMNLVEARGGVARLSNGDWSFQRLDNLNLLNFCLEANHPSWHDSLENLNSILFFHFTASEEMGLDPDYVRNITTVLASLSGGARYAVERCLLETLCRVSGGEQNPFEEKFTPDILLSTISGQ
ncbi:hypothetical protein FDENT_11005 [Fusarium denticulatum]|uniref:Tachykinin family protein n=1 Tax=Fusarium denticulatum TaxID=48507 RepID=A0A8H5TJT4_9HYPO|nr:hypothetical protein FDENT_11005 [Fusarium denticulatum]